MIYNFFWHILAFLARIAFRFDRKIVAPGLWKIKVVKTSNCSYLRNGNYSMYVQMTAARDVLGKDIITTEECTVDTIRNLRHVEDGCAPRITVKFYIPFKVDWVGMRVCVGRNGHLRGTGEQHTDLKPGIHTYEFFAEDIIDYLEKVRT